MAKCEVVLKNLYLNVSN